MSKSARIIEREGGDVNNDPSDNRELLDILHESLYQSTNSSNPKRCDLMARRVANCPRELADRILMRIFADPNESEMIINNIFYESMLQGNYLNISFLLDMGCSPPSLVIQMIYDEKENGGSNILLSLLFSHPFRTYFAMNVFKWFFCVMTNVKGDFITILRLSITTIMDNEESQCFLNWSAGKIISLLFKVQFSQADLTKGLRALIVASNSCGIDLFTIMMNKVDSLFDFNFYTFVNVLLTDFPDRVSKLEESYASRLLNKVLINSSSNVEIFRKVIQLTGASKCMLGCRNTKNLSQDTEFSKKIELLIDNTETFCISPSLLCHMKNPAVLMKYFIGPRPFHFGTIEWVFLESYVFSDKEMTQIVYHYMDHLTEEMVENFLRRLLTNSDTKRVVKILRMGLPVRYQNYNIAMKKGIKDLIGSVFGDARNQIVRSWKKAFLREEMLPMKTQTEKTAALIFYVYHQMTEEFRKTLETVQDTDTLLNMVPSGFFNEPTTVLLMLARTPSPNGIHMTKYFWIRLHDLMKEKV
jgi:hypothetical protein